MFSVFMKGYTIVGSIKAAMRGLIYAFQRERNFRVETYVAVVIIGALFGLHASLIHSTIIVTMIFLVFMIELMNTAIERVVDILKPQKHPYAGVIKDVSAASVLVLSIGASIVGVMIFVPLIIAAIK